MLERIRAGRTDLVFEALAAGLPASTADDAGVSLIRWCAYYGDVSAIRPLLAHGESPADHGRGRSARERFQRGRPHGPSTP